MSQDSFFIQSGLQCDILDDDLDIIYGKILACPGNRREDLLGIINLMLRISIFIPISDIDELDFHRKILIRTIRTYGRSDLALQRCIDEIFGG